MYDERNIKDIISPKICSRCGGEADEWRCPKCGRTFEHYDHLHPQKCSSNAKLQGRCKKCGEAEENCTCVAVN